MIIWLKTKIILFSSKGTHFIENIRLRKIQPFTVLNIWMIHLCFHFYKKREVQTGCQMIACDSEKKVGDNITVVHSGVKLDTKSKIYTFQSSLESCYSYFFLLTTSNEKRVFFVIFADGDNTDYALCPHIRVLVWFSFFLYI